MVCNSGVGLTPEIDGHTYHFSAGGLYNGLVLLVDDETNSYWDHITGEALHGAMAGRQMDVWGIQMTTVARALADTPDLLLLRSRQSLRARMISWFLSRPFTQTIIPPGFRRTMGPPDSRLAEMTMGLGLFTKNHQRFYPLERIGEGVVDIWRGRSLRIVCDPMNGIPIARYRDNSRPLQMFTRWYGFSYTFPGSEIFNG